MPARDASAGDQPLPRGLAAGTCFPRDLPGCGDGPRPLWAPGKGLRRRVDGMERGQLGAANPSYPACAALLGALWLSLVLVTAWIRAFEVTVAQSPRSLLFRGRQAGLVPRRGEACAMAECRGCR